MAKAKKKSSIPESKPSEATPTLRERIESIAERTPRFLFRAWSGGSGGGAKGLNSPEAIVPHSFNGKRLSLGTTIHDLSQGEIRRLASGHLRGERLSTPFSSWTQCLETALSISTGMDLGTAHLSILDTKRLPRENVVMWTPAMYESDLATHSFPHEYLAFGVINGSAHRAVLIQDLADNGLNELLYGSRDRFDRWRKRPIPQSEKENIEEAKQLGNLFGDNFGLPMAVHILAREHVVRPIYLSENVICQELSKLFVPKEWAFDRTIMEDGFALIDETSHYPHVAATIKIFRLLVEQQQRSVDRSDQNGTRKRKRVEFHPSVDEAEASKKRKLSFERTESNSEEFARQREVRELRMRRELPIEMNGWELHNTSVRDKNWNGKGVYRMDTKE